MEKRVIVYLDTGTTKENVLTVEDEAAYVKKYYEIMDSLKEKSPGLLVFGTPLCIYKIQNIIAIEFVDPPLPSDKLPMGFIPTKQ